MPIRNMLLVQKHSNVCITLSGLVSDIDVSPGLIEKTSVSWAPALTGLTSFPSPGYKSQFLIIANIEKGVIVHNNLILGKVH